MGLIFVICILLCIICTVVAFVNLASNDSAWGAAFATSAILFALLGNTIYSSGTLLKQYKESYIEATHKIERLQDDLSSTKVRAERLHGELELAKLVAQTSEHKAEACESKLENISEVLEK